MLIIKELLKDSKWPLVIATLAAIGSSVLSIAVIHFINNAINAGGFTAKANMAGFFCLVVAAFGASVWSQRVLLNVSTGLTRDLQVSLSRNIVAVNYEKFEHAGKHKLYATLNSDVSDVTMALAQIPWMLANATAWIAANVYLAMLSFRLLLLVFLVVIVAALVGQLFLRRMQAYLTDLREKLDATHKYFETFVEGAKELRLYTFFRKQTCDVAFSQVISSAREISIKAQFLGIVATNWGQLIFLLVIGLVLALQGSLTGFDSRVLSGFVLTILFLKEPVANLVGVLPIVAKGQVSLRKIRTLNLEFLSDELADSKSSGSERAVTSHKGLVLAGVEYSFGAAGDRVFTLGPLDLTVNRGEVVFITGGNGAGKSTLGKLITGLYAPHRGAITIDYGSSSAGAVVDEAGRRNLFAAIFSDFYVFEQMVDSAGSNVSDHAVRGMLKKLGLDKRVAVNEGKFSTTTQLSQGQKKRLALVVALICDRPFYLFDEWASEQDSQFKHYFYNELLRELKEKNKAVVVITHDDEYFGLADRTYKLVGGRLIEGLVPAPLGTPHDVPCTRDVMT